MRVDLARDARGSRARLNSRVGCGLFIDRLEAKVVHLTFPVPHRERLLAAVQKSEARCGEKRKTSATDGSGRGGKKGSESSAIEYSSAMYIILPAKPLGPLSNAPQARLS